VHTLIDIINVMLYCHRMQVRTKYGMHRLIFAAHLPAAFHY